MTIEKAKEVKEMLHQLGNNNINPAEDKSEEVKVKDLKQQKKRMFLRVKQKELM